MKLPNAMASTIATLVLVFGMSSAHAAFVNHTTESGTLEKHKGFVSLDHWHFTVHDKTKIQVKLASTDRPTNNLELALYSVDSAGNLGKRLAGDNGDPNAGVRRSLWAGDYAVIAGTLDFNSFRPGFRHLDPREPGLTNYTLSIWGDAWITHVKEGDPTGKGKYTKRVITSKVPEPAMLSLMGAGLLAFGVSGRRSRKTKVA